MGFGIDKFQYVEQIKTAVSRSEVLFGMQIKALKASFGNQVVDRVTVFEAMQMI